MYQKSPGTLLIIHRLQDSAPRISGLGEGAEILLMLQVCGPQFETQQMTVLDCHCLLVLEGSSLLGLLTSTREASEPSWREDT
jgi:hypothetical protein